jgi:hypothetical protein
VGCERELGLVRLRLASLGGWGGGGAGGLGARGVVCSCALTRGVRLWQMNQREMYLLQSMLAMDSL